ncbi:tetratricopeptide repeat protein [Candidatus Uabimicrobium amorphum]|uniref:O-GlcNAc transferase n=1 Tax=Uabimicrobium amorphum TaxID=2596890 RepID=A0A5S9IKK0_UABAM|nr:tetratricopeptide repeat protein [Candidatus Uabimicrobium amorphum]BBM83578.1 O-GlcNAc transferase [Candidatus Uabimicrobium amorphum]
MQRNILTFIAICACVALVYLPTFSNDFCLDDTVIFSNCKNLPNILPLLYKPMPHRLVDHYRPITFATFYIDYKLWGEEAFGYHLTNVLLMSTCGCLLLLLLKEFFSHRAALTACIIFVIHPGYSEAVINIYSRSQILCTIMVISALLYSLKAVYRSSRLHAIFGGVSTFAACLCKESGIVTPALFVIIILYAQHRRYQQAIYVFFIQCCACIVYLIVRLNVLGSVLMPGTEGFLTSVNLYSQYQNICRLFFEYISLSIFPLSLSCDYNFAIVDFHISSVVTPIVVLYMTYSLWYGSYRKRSCACAFFLFLIPLLPVLHIVPISVIFAERFLLVSGIGIAFMISFVVETRGRTIVICSAILLAMITFWRCYDWRNNETLWMKTLCTKPRSYRAKIFKGSYHLRRKNTQYALSYFSQALALKPNANNRVLLYYNLAVIYHIKSDIPRMNYYANEVIKIIPHYVPLWLLLAENAIVHKRYKQGLHYFNNFLRYENKNKNRWTFDYGTIYAKIGHCFFYDKNWKKACFFYDKAIEHNNISTKLLLNNAYGCLMQLRYQKSQQYLLQAYRQDKSNYRVHYLLAVLYYKTNQMQKFQVHYKKAKVLKPVDLQLPTVK